MPQLLLLTRKDLFPCATYSKDEKYFGLICAFKHKASFHRQQANKSFLKEFKQPLNQNKERVRPKLRLVK